MWVLTELFEELVRVWVLWEAALDELGMVLSFDGVVVCIGVDYAYIGSERFGYSDILAGEDNLGGGLCWVDGYFPFWGTAHRVWMCCLGLGVIRFP